MQDRNEMDNRRMQERDREMAREWNREPGYPRHRDEFRDRPEREYSFQRRREEDEGFMSQNPGRGSMGWGSESGYQRRYENDPNYGRGYPREYGREYSSEGQFRPQQWRDQQWREPQRSGQSQFDAGDYGRPHEDYGPGREWNDQQQFRGTSGRFAGGMGTYGGGLSEYTERGRFSGRGPKGFQRSDDRIREDVCERLTQHPAVDASEIEIRVNNGEVTLTGSVDERTSKRIAEEIVEQIFGVRDVHNQIRVQHQTAGVGQASQSGQGTTGQLAKAKS